MKGTFHTTAAVVLLLVVSVCAVEVKNSSFEDIVDGSPVGWSLYGVGMRAEPEAGCNGNGGLVWESAAPLESQSGASCELTGWTPGEEYEFSAQVRTENFDTPSYKGVNLCIEWYGDDGKYMGGSYCPGGKGSPEWKTLFGATTPIPDGARRVLIRPYIGLNSSGKAFFDDIVVRPRRRSPVHYLCSDAYRDVVAEGTVQFAASILVPKSFQGKAVGVFRYRGDDGKIRMVPAQTLTQTEAVLRVDATELALGSQTISFELAANGVLLGSAELAFSRVGELPNRCVWIDRHNRCIVDGKPFFPLGMYFGDITKEDLAVYANGPFNCIMPYGVTSEKHLDLCSSAGLMTFVSFQGVADGSKNARKYKIDTPAKVDAFFTNRISRLKNHPAVLGWYVFDEAPQPEIPARLRIFKSIRLADDQHPAWGVYHRLDNLREYLPICDILGIDPYPIPAKPVGSIAELMRIARKALFGNRVMWNVPQTFNWGRKDVPDDRFPTEDELRSMYWQYLVCGANGLIGYSFGWMRKRESPEEFSRQWATVCKVAGEIRDLIPVILSIEDVPSLGVSQDKAVCRAWAKGGILHIAVCNVTSGPIETTVVLGDGSWKMSGPAFWGRVKMVTDRSLSVNLPPTGVALVRLEPTVKSVNN